MRCSASAALPALITVRQIKPRLGLMVAGCLVFALGATRSTYAASAADPCSSVSQVSITTVLSSAVGDGKPTRLRDCVWPQPGSGLNAKSVLLEILEPIGNQTPANRFNTAKAPLPIKGITKTPVSSIGDEAVHVAADPIRTALYVRKGNFVFRVQADGLAAEEARAKDKAKAGNFLAKL